MKDMNLKSQLNFFLISKKLIFLVKITKFDFTLYLYSIVGRITQNLYGVTFDPLSGTFVLTMGLKVINHLRFFAAFFYLPETVMNQIKQ